MANFFYDGMPNVNERLNTLYSAFAAGPYNAVPLTGGTMTGPLTTTSTVTALRVGTAGIIEQLALLTNAGIDGIAGTALRFGYPGVPGYGTRIVGAGNPSTSYAGYTAFEVGVGNGSYREIARFTERGALLIGTVTEAAQGQLQVVGPVQITSSPTVGPLLMTAGAAVGNAAFLLYAGDGTSFPQPASVMYVGKYSGTGRSVSANGTVNTSGSDYAEYILKSETCNTVIKGQIIGITAVNTLTDKWEDAVLFGIKSTEPSFVGGDSWANCVGPRPTPRAGPAPTPPPRRAGVGEQQPLPGTNPPECQDLVTPGDTDAEWAAKQAAYAAALAAHGAAMQQDAEAMAAFDAALETERQKVDRIAIAGRVPVNVLGARPGDYIVPVQDGDGIKGIAVREDDLTMKQYLHAVGRVISIEPDGRAYVMVKAV